MVVSLQTAVNAVEDWMDMLTWSPAGKRDLLPLDGIPIPPEPPRRVNCWADPLGLVWAEEISSPPFAPKVLLAMGAWLSANGYLCMLKTERGRNVLLSRHNSLRYVVIDEAGHPR